MATKRPAPHVHASRRGQVPGEPSRKRRKTNNPFEKSFKKAHPVNQLKSQIRSIKRLLERDERLPATVRVEKERELQTAQRALQASQHAKEKSDMIGRYHKVRFFDKQKATKRLKRAKKELQECEGNGRESRAVLKEKVRNAEVDVLYAQYFPLDEHYVSLFPRKRVDAEDVEDEKEKEREETEPERRGDPDMRRRVEDCMVLGTLDDLRNGKLKQQKDGLNESSEEVTWVGKKAQRLSDIPHRAAEDMADEEGDDETGGDFFE